MRTLTAADLEPTCSVANFFRVPMEIRWGPRTMPDPELVLALTGRLRYRQHNQTWISVRSTEILFIPPETIHELEPDPSGGSCTISCWHGELSPTGTWAAGDYQLCCTPKTITAVGQYPVIAASFRRLAEVFQGYEAEKGLFEKELLRVIWLHLMTLWEQEEEPSSKQRLDPILTWIRERLDRPLGRTEIANAFSLTPGHVNALFHNGLGTTPGAFIRRERILAAYQELLCANSSIAEVAQHWGFDDPFHFSRVFRQIMGFPPSRAR